MNRSKRMEPVARLADTRQQKAARQLGDWQKTLEDRLARLDELSGYRDEYAQRFESSTSVPLNGLGLRDYRLFLSRLNQAIEQQMKLVQAARAELERSRGQWVEARGRTEAINRVVERFEVEERHEMDRREQAEQDDRNVQRKSDF
ncbi:flagellar export protein FliJ [Ectothiorhodospira sp. BSL-9]|uniref:flagellar export protein FliJ n=1 Tax=Ectothiorhodospira sp. BSL-9 TaxID=1442136 RepID=UPI0007B44FB2|nr:flagellar export protein FliJ [Ectothiorhodospira sp. BSL-9]ANB02794.1 flagellar export protein FliJ [Ectothiorhodospira sp. BSL-9]